MFTKTSFGRTEDRGATLNRGCVSFCFVASNFWMCAEVAGGITFGILAGTLSAMLTESNASQQEAQEQVGLYSTLLALPSLTRLQSTGQNGSIFIIC